MSTREDGPICPPSLAIEPKDIALDFDPKDCGHTYEGHQSPKIVYIYVFFMLCYVESLL